MKRLKLAIIILLVLSLSGCVKETKISEKQSDAVAEYAAGLILKYDRDYDQELSSQDELSNNGSNSTAITAPAQNSTQGTTVTGTAGNNTDIKTYNLTDVIGKKDFSIDYKNYKLVKCYPEDSDHAYFTLEPRDGYQLMVVSFKVKNTSKSDNKLSLSEDDINYSLSVNGKKGYEPLLTLLENDLKYIDMTIGGGKTKNAILIFEVSKNDKLSNVSLEVSQGDKSTTVVMK